MSAPNLTPALDSSAIYDQLTLASEWDDAWRRILARLEELDELEKSRPLLPENARKLIEVMAPFLEVRRSSVLDCGAPLSELQAEDFETYRKMMVATLTPAEREAVDKFAAERAAPSSAAPAAKNRHQEQLRDEGGRWRASLFRRGDTKPNLPGLSFFR